MPMEIPPPPDSLYKDDSLYNKHHQMGYQGRPSPQGGAMLRDNDYSYVKDIWPSATGAGATPTGAPGTHAQDTRMLEPVYQVQNIRGSPSLAVSSTSPAGPGMTDPLANPYGIEYFGPNTNPYGSKLGLQTKGKKPPLVAGDPTGSMGSDEGQHIYESPDGIRDYNTMNTQHFELDGKIAQKHPTPTKTANIRAPQRI